ncbi:MAG: hypothetical protein C4290_13765 [Chloroflexota bacterium]
MVRVAIDTTAPYVQAPSHIMPKGDGTFRGVNYDHTVLGWRASWRLTPHLSDPAHLLPMTQAMWYVPQGLDVWDQVLCEFPGHYARDQEKCDERDTAQTPERAAGIPGPTGTTTRTGSRFNGPAWRPPKVHFEDHPPLRHGSVEERLARMWWAILTGERVEGYRLFLGLAEEPEPAVRTRLKDTILMAGIIDLQETIIQRGSFQNIGHKALRARAMLDLADTLGWENAHGVFYTVVPDLGCTPRFHELWALTSNLLPMEFRDWQELKRTNTAPLTEREVDEVVDVINWGQPGDVVALITELLRRGRALLAIADAIVIAFVHNELTVMEHPNAFFTPGHAFDYCNVVNHWLRTYDNPHQAKALYFEALFVNDVLRANMLFPRDPAMALESPKLHARAMEQKSEQELLLTLTQAIDAQDAPRALAAVDEYLARTDERETLIATLSYAASKIQNDPHVARKCASSIEEYRHNTTSRKDDILRAWAKYLARAVRRSTDLGCYRLFRQHFLGDRDAYPHP